MRRDLVETGLFAALAMALAWLARFPSSLYVEAVPLHAETPFWVDSIARASALEGLPLRGLVLQLVGGCLAALSSPVVGLSIAVVLVVGAQAALVARGDRPQRLAVVAALTLSPFALGLLAGGRYGLLLGAGGVALAALTKRPLWVLVGVALAAAGRVEAGIAAGVLVACGGGRRIPLGLGAALLTGIVFSGGASAGAELSPATLLAVEGLSPRGGLPTTSPADQLEFLSAPWTGLGVVLLVAGSVGIWKTRRWDLAFGAAICALLSFGNTILGPFGGPWILVDRALPELEPAAFLLGTAVVLGVGLVQHRGRWTWALGPLLILEGLLLAPWPLRTAGFSGELPTPALESPAVDAGERIARIADLGALMALNPMMYIDMAPPDGQRPDESRPPDEGENIGPAGAPPGQDIGPPGPPPGGQR